MKAIVIVFVPGQNGAEVPEQSLAVRSADISSALGRSEIAPTNFSQLPDRNQSPAPFWTWFIENPRLTRV